MIVIIDNFDSFVHNLARYFRLQGAETTVIRNNDITVDECLAMKPAGIIISPGPKSPKDAGISLALCAAMPPTAPCRCMAGWGIHATSRSSIFIATIAAIASPKAARRSRCARLPVTCSASWVRTSDNFHANCPAMLCAVLIADFYRSSSRTRDASDFE